MTESERGKSVNDMASASSTATRQIKATVQTFDLPQGVYALTVVDGGTRPGEAGGLRVPTAHVAVAPGGSVSVETMGTVAGNWLAKRGDTVVVKVPEGTARVVLTSYKADGAETDSLSIRMTEVTGGGQPVAAAAPAKPSGPEVMVHVQSRGDLYFPAGAWAGCAAERLWVEGIIINQPSGLAPEDLEYKALLATGWETPWTTGGNLCGSRGAGVPIIGFAIRLAGTAAVRYKCVYEGIFASGRQTGPVSDGAGCRSDVPNDPLLAFRLSFMENLALAAPAAGRT